MDTYDVVVAGAGIGGISAAVAAARAGARTLLLESADAVGGTGVHSPLALVCLWYSDKTGLVVNAGLTHEFFPQTLGTPVGSICSYDPADLAARYRTAIAAEPLLTLRTGAPVVAAACSGRRVSSLRLGGAAGGEVAGAVVVDGTADGHLAALAGCGFDLGRDGDGRLQPCTLTFIVEGIDFAALGLPADGISTWAHFHTLQRALDPVYQRAKAEGRLDCPREDVLCFPLPDGRRILFNQTRVLGVDPTDPVSLERGLAEGRRQMESFMAAMRAHPGLARARALPSPRLGVREGRRIHGEHLLTAEECMAEARFADMVAACGYPVDIHSPTGAGTRLEHIPGSGYYHIPYRCLVARDRDNLLMGSRCISATHEAHASYRVMPPVSAIGQAAGVAAALAARRAGAVRAVEAKEIRAVLRGQGQFVEEVAG